MPCFAQISILLYSLWEIRMGPKMQLIIKKPVEVNRRVNAMVCLPYPLEPLYNEIFLLSLEQWRLFSLGVILCLSRGGWRREKDSGAGSLQRGYRYSASIFKSYWGKPTAYRSKPIAMLVGDEMENPFFGSWRRQPGDPMMAAGEENKPRGKKLVCKDVVKKEPIACFDFTSSGSTSASKSAPFT